MPRLTWTKPNEAAPAIETSHPPADACSVVFDTIAAAFEVAPLVQFR